ncbi:MAG: SCO family protein [Bacteroidota bacterium]
MRKTILFGFIALLIGACGSEQAAETGPLPYLGENIISDKGDTIYYKIPAFGFVDQDSTWVTDESVDSKIYVTDFFFTSCLSICRKMKQQMLKVHEVYAEDEEIMLLSHTIDPNYDSVEVLKEYADDLDLMSDHWRFLTGDKDSIYAMGARYFVAANEDPNSQDGFYHTDVFTLVDKERRVRGVYHGTDSLDVKRLIVDIERLKQEYEAQNP